MQNVRLLFTFWGNIYSIKRRLTMLLGYVKIIFRAAERGAVEDSRIMQKKVVDI